MAVVGSGSQGSSAGGVGGGELELRGQSGGPALIHLWRREQGLLTPEGNPSHLTGVAELHGLRVA